MFFAENWAYVGQPDNHIGWAKWMPFTLIDPTYPRTNLWNFEENCSAFGGGWKTHDWIVSKQMTNNGPLCGMDHQKSKFLLISVPFHTVAIWSFTFHKRSGFVKVILKTNFKPLYRPVSWTFWSEYSDLL